MTDVYVRAAPQNTIRLGMAISVVAWWAGQSNVNLHLIVAEPAVGTNWYGLPVEAKLPLAKFHWLSRQWADDHALSEPYFLADDDRMPIGPDWLKRALATWERHSDYALLSNTSYLPVERPANHAGADEVFEAPHCCGAGYFAKRGIVPYRDMVGKPSEQDNLVCEWLRAKGHKFGYMRDLYDLHLGFGHSQAEPLLWGRY